MPRSVVTTGWPRRTWEVANRVAGRHGFSLIELLVVIVIIGLIMSLVTVRLDFLTPKSRLSAAGRSLASSIILGHNRAVTLGKSVTIQYNMAKNFSRLILPPAGPKQPPQAMSQIEMPQGVRYEDIVTTTGRKYLPSSDLVVEITISPMGTIMGHVIHLVNDKGQKLTLEVNPLTGLVQLQDGYRPLELVEKCD